MSALRCHQQPEANYLPRFNHLLISLERSPLRGDHSREIDLFENLDIVHIRLLVVASRSQVAQHLQRCPASVVVCPYAAHHGSGAHGVALGEDWIFSQRQRPTVWVSGRGAEVPSTISSHVMYLLNSYRKPTPPKNRQLVVYFY